MAHRLRELRALGSAVYPFALQLAYVFASIIFVVLYGVLPRLLTRACASCASLMPCPPCVHPVVWSTYAGPPAHTSPRYYLGRCPWPCRAAVQ